MLKRTLAVLALVAVSLAVCPANYEIANLQAGSVSFSAANAPAMSSQSYTKQFDDAFPSEPAIAIAVQDFELNQFTANNFAVYPAHVNRMRVIFQWDYSASVWVRIRLNFWASANPEVQLGHIRVDNINANNGRAFAHTDISRAFDKHQRPVIRTFINGYDITSDVLQLATAPANLQGTRLTIGISVGQNTKLRRLWVSYIAFSPSTASFVSYGGQISQRKFAGSVSSDISNSLYNTPYMLIGLNLVSLGNSQPISFETQLQHAFHCQVSASRLVEEFSLVYIALGVAPSQLCSSCGRYAIASENQCVTACPSGSSPFTYPDGGVGCRSCPDGHVLADGKCVPGVVQTESVTTTTVRAPGTTTSSTAGSSSSGSSSSGSSMTSTSSGSSGSSPRNCPENSFDNGVECVCEVGYAFIAGRCQLLKMQIKTTKVTTTTTTTTTTVHQMGHDDSSSSGSSSTGSTSTAQPTQPSQPQPQSPVPCPAGYVRVNGNCQMNTPAQCPANSHDNGLGTCVCNDGFYFSNNACVTGAPCPANSRRVSADKCECNQGFNDYYDGVCSRCPPGALWSSVSTQCIYVCGQNSAYSQQAGKCACNPGFGLINGMCDVCPQNHFISNGYCVTCPLHSVYNSGTRRCECNSGFFTNEFGLCVKKCGQNEEYDIASHSCRCLQGLGKVNGVCQVCPRGSRPTADGSSCNPCRPNEELRSGQCVCASGYAPNSAGVCTVCSSLPNGFIINGVCSKCPGSKVFDGSSRCICPAGKVESGSQCISQCKSDELIDAEGNCYSCALNQIVSNGRCVCRAGFRLSSCGVCELSCSNSEFPFQGGCAQCPLNTQYSALTNGCVCPQGYYKDTYGICQKLELIPIDCPTGQYFDDQSGCVPCAAPCQSCSSASVCTTCIERGYEPDGAGVCQPKCGDGLIVGNENCDSGSRSDPGCVGCRVQANYTCSGQPSVCNLNTPTVPIRPTPPVVTPPIRTASLSQVGNANINSNNVFITLQTTPTFNFANPTEMQSFIKADFPHGITPTVYCSQRDSPELDLFDCLLIYPSGVPNSNFEVDFSFDDGPGKQANTDVSVDPLTATYASARLNSRRRG